MIVRTGTFVFPAARGIEVQTQQQSFNFTRSVRQAVAILAGTNFGFSPRDDHHLGKVVARLSTAIDDDVVTVVGNFGVRDWSGDVDDNYQGNIQFVLLAELEDNIILSNLAITGVEYNQVTQFFRSQLDPATAQADNSIALIAGKNTVMRVFVDTQNDPSRPTIAMLSGRLEIRLPGSSTWSAVGLLNGPIAPRLDSTIQRRNANDTLNFLIPGAFCRGNVDFRVRVFDSAHADQPGYTSGVFQGTLQFAQTAPLRLRGVGVRWTGQTPAVPAPTLAQLNTTLGFVVKGYPTSQVFITGFETIDYNGNFQSTSGGGCGPGWGGLLSRLREMQGDSDDIYFGLVPAAVPSSASGCGGGDGQVAACLVAPTAASSRLQTATQEIAHAFGRDHACGSPPLDPNYPIYNSFPTASIGEVGIDDQGNVQDPATTLDFMAQASCSTTRWVSPYTYQALRSEFPAVPSSPDLQRTLMLETDSEVESMRGQFLFLSFRIYRGGQVELFPSFHYLSEPKIKQGRPTPYAIELRDAEGRVLEAQRVSLTDPYGDLDSPHLDFYKPIPFPEETARVIIMCDGAGACDQKQLHAVNVPKKPPKVKISEPKGNRELKGQVRVAWQADDDDQRLRYLLRYSNDGGQSFRALAPSLSERQYTVNLDALPGGDRCQFQVLATSGIRTGAAVSDFFKVAPKPREVTIEMETPQAVMTRGETLRLRGDAFSPDSGSVDPTEIRWSSDLDGPLGVGREIQIRTLSPGLHTILLVAPDGLGGETVQSLQVRVEAPVRINHTSKEHSEHTQQDHDTGKVPPYPPGQQTTTKKSSRRSSKRDSQSTEEGSTNGD